MSKLIRLPALVLVLCLLPLGACASGLRYRLSLDARAADDAPPLAQGLAELMQAVTLEGTLAAAGSSFDLTAELVLDGSERTRTPFRLYGTETHINMETPLLGSRKVLLYMAVLQEFAMKMYNHMAIPMQYVTIFYPFATRDTVRELTAIWDPVLFAASGPRTVSREALADMAQRMGDRLSTAELPFYYIEALSADTGYDYMLFSLFSDMADWCRLHLPDEGLLIVSGADGQEHWIAGDTTIAVLSPREGSLKLDGLGGDKSLEFAYAASPEGGSVLFRLDLTQDNRSLLHVRLQGDDLPTSLPFEGSFTAALDLTGDVVSTHETRITVNGSCRNRVLTVQATVEGLFDEITLTCALTPDDTLPDPHYVLTDLDGVNVFTLSDVSFGEFIRSVMGPLARGVLPLVPHIPVSLCVACMDILTQGDVFDVLSGQGSFHDADRPSDAMFPDGTEDDDWDFWNDLPDEDEIFEEDDWDF